MSLIFSAPSEEPSDVPSDEKHTPLLDAVAWGKAGEEVEKACPSCHNAREHPLPKNHPPKEHV